MTGLPPLARPSPLLPRAAVRHEPNHVVCGAPVPDKECEIGKKCDLGKSSVTVTSARKTEAINTSLDNFQGSFVLVEFEYTFGGSRPVTLDESPWLLEDDSGQRLDNPNLTVTFPLSKKLALITRPKDRGLKHRHFHYHAVAEVVAWVNTRTQLASLGTLYSASDDFGLLRKGNEIVRSTDYFAHWDLLRRGANLP